MYHQCLPIFGEQAQACVEHFRREQVKCGAGGPEPARLDSSERQWVQTALAVGAHSEREGRRSDQPPPFDAITIRLGDLWP